MKIKLKSVIILSYVLIILIFFLGMTFIVNNYILDSLPGKHIKYTEDGIDELTEKNKQFAKQALLAVSRDFIDLYVDEAAVILSTVIRNKNYDKPEQLQQNAKLRKLLCRPIKYKGVDVGYTALLGRDSRLLIHPCPELENEFLSIWRKKLPSTWNVFQEALQDGAGRGYHDFWSADGETIEKKYLAIMNIPQTDLYICSSIDFYIISNPVNEAFNRLELEYTGRIRQDIEKHSLVLAHVVQKISLLLIIFLAFVCILFAMWIANKISGPITQLNIAAKKLGEGKFDTVIGEMGSVETVELSRTFNELGEQLTRYMDNLKNEITVREALESELKIARNIQKSLLQANCLQDSRQELSLFANLYPAKEVAGDFYDFFYLNEAKRDRLAVLVADVSGKGIYAAIFMAMAKTVLKNLCQAYPDSPGEVLKRANNLYLNSANMFVTVFLGYYNINSGEMSYANGGHHGAIHLGADGSFEEFGVFYDPLLGLFPNNFYHTGTIRFQFGDTLFLYTDGVTEAINNNEELFGQERLRTQLLNNVKNMPDESCANIFASVRKFEEGNRFDDITMLMLRREQ